MRLVQPATVPQSRSWQQDNALKPLLKALDIKPSGIPEMSDGAVPEALFRFINCRRLKKFGNIRLRLSVLGEETTDRFVTMHYLVRERQEDQLRAELSNWGEQPLIMRVRPAKTAKSFNFCIDEDAECFFWVASQGRTLLEKTLPISAKMFRSAMKPLRPTAITLEGILNEVEQIAEDHYSRMERHDD